MIELFYCVRRKAGITREEAHAHWLYPHAPLGVRDHRVLRYVQHHAMDWPLPSVTTGQSLAQPDYDGVAAAWWESAATMKEYNETPQIIEDQGDMLLFIDHSQSVGVLVEEHQVVEPTGLAPVVVFQFLARPRSMSAQDFASAWTTDGQTGQIRRAASGAQREHLLQGLLLNVCYQAGDFTLDADGTEDVSEAWDGVAVLYFNSVATLKGLSASAYGSTLLLSEATDYVDRERSRQVALWRKPQKEIAGAVR